MDLYLDPQKHSDAAKPAVIDVDDPSNRKIKTLATTVPELVTNLSHKDIAPKRWENYVSLCLVDSSLAFEVAHVKAVAGGGLRQVSTTVTLASALGQYKLKYYLIPYTESNGDAQDLLFYFDVYGNRKFALDPHMDGVHALYHRHPPSEYKTEWMEDVYDDSIHEWAQGLVDDDVLEDAHDAILEALEAAKPLLLENAEIDPVLHETLKDLISLEAGLGQDEQWESEMHEILKALRAWIDANLSDEEGGTSESAAEIAGEAARAAVFDCVLGVVVKLENFCGEEADEDDLLDEAHMDEKSRMKREKKSRGAVRRGDPSEPLSDKKKLVMVFETEIKNQTAPLVDDSTDDEFAGLPEMQAAALEPYMTIYGNTPYVVMYTIYILIHIIYSNTIFALTEGHHAGATRKGWCNEGHRACGTLNRDTAGHAC